MKDSGSIKYLRDEKDSLFLAGLKEEVRNYFRARNIHEYGNVISAAKAVSLLLLFFMSYGLLISGLFSPLVTLLLGILCGLFTVLIVFNISHDASHHCLSRNQRLNKIMTYTLYLVGGNAYTWDITHNRIHHTYPNVFETDPDIYQAAPLVRVSPADPYKSYHRYQHLYAPLLYLTHSLYLIYLKDFQDFGLIPKKEFSLKGYRHKAKHYILLFSGKLFYIFYSLVLPLLVLEIAWWKILLSYILIHILMSALLSAVLIPVHMVEGNVFPQADSRQMIEHSWVRSIFENTIDYSSRSRLANFLFGGLNTHMAHHLFPQICHVHLVGVSEIIHNAAKREGLPCRDLSMWGAIRAHFRLLKKMSLAP